MCLAKFKGGYFLKKSGLQTQLKIYSFKCNCCGEYGTTEQLKEKVLAFFKILGTSGGYITGSTRCVKYNKQCGGAKHSKHLKPTLAIDYQNIKIHIEKIFNAVIKAGFNGVGIYKGKVGYYIHADIRITPCYWYRTKGIFWRKKYIYFKTPKACWEEFYCNYLREEEI